MGNEKGGGPVRVLIVDDEENQRQGLASMVAAWGYAADTAADGEEALGKLAAQPAQVMITDLMMPRMDGAELLRRLNVQGAAPVTIVVTAFGSLETAISTIHELGAFWFMEKPIQARALRTLLARAVSQSRLAEETERLQRQLSYQGTLGDLTGRSAAMQQVFSLVGQVAPSRAVVLITGESGTGKEIVARTVHRLSPRRDGPFVAVNCAAMPETLMESELFGHEKGAFTGAVERRAGCFELAQNGTLLLDEIGDMPVGTQAKLLRVLEDSHVRRLGGKSEIVVDVRVIASTNKRLEEALQKGQVREDLYYRLNVFRVHLPPLRERKEDIPALCEVLLRDINRKHGCRVADLAPAVMDAFQRHYWPGNIRELRNVLERAVIIAGEGTLTAAHLPHQFGAPAPGPLERLAGDPASVLLRVGTTVDEAEKALIFKTLEHTRNNKTRAAEILGISLKTLHNKLKEYGSDEAEP
ncbi:MAG TPA: sigma-54 dependent transcriptional regulator [Bryobacteraceae bacterium]|nr:sigma-54 dependent transcriptional regulator [Bryobacteraceae bacterium]